MLETFWEKDRYFSKVDISSMLKLQIGHIFYLTVYFSYAYILSLSIKKSGQIYILTKTYSTYLTIQQTFNLIIHLTDWQQLWKLAIYMS